MKRFVHFLVLLNVSITHFTAGFYQTYCENLQTFRKIKRVIHWAPIYLQLNSILSILVYLFYLYMCICIFFSPFFLLNHLK